MNHPHSVALGLLMWLLISPVIYEPTTNPHIQPNDPMSRWTIERRFASREACEQFKTDYVETALKMFRVVEKNPEAMKEASEKQHLDPRYMKTLVQRMEREQCIASDDPRLKAK